MKTHVKYSTGVSGVEVTLNLYNLWGVKHLQDRLEKWLAENNGRYSAEITLEEVMMANNFLWNIINGVPLNMDEDDAFAPHELKGARDLTPHREEESIE